MFTKTKPLIILAITILLTTPLLLSIPPQTVEGQSEAKNVILIGWDGVQRNHLFELLNAGRLQNLSSLSSQGNIVNITVSDHGTDTKAGWTQILTGYRWPKTGVYNNVYWFHSVPAGYTIQERAENYFGSDAIATAFIAGKLFHMEIQDGTGDTANGRYTNQALYRNLPGAIDVCTNGDKNAGTVGPSMLQFLDSNAQKQFFAFFHFSDPDSAGHNQQVGGENSAMYEQAIIRCDNWLGRILNRLSTLGIAEKTLVYVTADHGFDEGGNGHNFAPYVTLATNDVNVNRDGDEVDVAPTIYYALGMWGSNFHPALDGYPLQISLPEGVEQRRQEVLADVTQPPKATFTSPTNGINAEGTVNIEFNASDTHLGAALLLIDNSLVADSPWTWRVNDRVEVNGSYAWDITGISYGSHTITLLAFDEHGAYNAPSTVTRTVNKPAPPSTSNPTQNPTPTPHHTAPPQATPTPQPSNQSSSPTPTSQNSPSANSQTSDSSFRMEYLYAGAILVAVAVIAVSVAVYLRLEHS